MPHIYHQFASDILETEHLARSTVAFAWNRSDPDGTR